MCLIPAAKASRQSPIGILSIGWSTATKPTKTPSESLSWNLPTCRGFTQQPLEVALFMRTERDVAEGKDLEQRGGRIRQSREVAATPEKYRAYIQGSRGEFSCAKRSYVKLQNAWISDRTLCYLASGKPVVVQNTGPSSFLPSGQGIFRFSACEEAAQALAAINVDYERNCRAAREIAETHFDSKQSLETILKIALPQIGKST